MPQHDAIRESTFALGRLAYLKGEDVWSNPAKDMPYGDQRRNFHSQWLAGWSAESDEVHRCHTEDIHIRQHVRNIQRQRKGH